MEAPDAFYACIGPWIFEMTWDPTYEPVTPAPDWAVYQGAKVEHFTVDLSDSYAKFNWPSGPNGEELWPMLQRAPSDHGGEIYTFTPPSPEESV